MSSTSAPEPSAAKPDDFRTAAVHGFLIADLVVSLTPLFFVLLGSLLSALGLLDPQIANQTIAKGLGARAAIAGVITGFIGLAVAALGDIGRLWPRAALPLMLSAASYVGIMFVL